MKARKASRSLRRGRHKIQAEHAKQIVAEFTIQSVMSYFCNNFLETGIAGQRISQGRSRCKAGKT